MKRQDGPAGHRAIQVLKDHIVMEVVSILSAKTPAAREQALEEITNLAWQYQQRCLRYGL